jgi:UPF0755 protein
MTDYGRGPGSQPWHPEDPLYGDQAWNGGRQAGSQDGWDPLTDPYTDPYAADPYATGQQPYVQGGGYQGDPYAEGGYPGDPYGASQHPGPQYPHHQDPGHRDPGYQGPGRQDPRYTGPGPHDTGWQQPVPPEDPYRTGSPPQHPGTQPPYGGPAGAARPPQDPGATDPYGMEAVPHGSGARPAGRGSGLPRNGPDPETGWDPGPDQGESAFFRDDDEDDDRYADDAPSGRRGGRKRGGGTKRRSGTACLVVLLLLGGVLGVAGWFGYRFYQSHFAAAPDYPGEGHGQVQVEIPEGSSVADMAAALEKAGVIKSNQAFIDASAADGNKAQSVQPGFYTLHKEMSADAAIDMMLDPASQNSLTVPEGKRAKQIYEMIDAKLGEKDGTTAEAAESADLGLPDWAKDNPEGFLFPARYSVGEQTTPEDLLKAMVERAKTTYRKIDLEAQAEKMNRSPREIVIIASLVQAEAQENEDFGKVSRVVYNRLDIDMKLQFDSTINYAKGESVLRTSTDDTKYESPYNTYLHLGLPPGPIDNPGMKAIEAALNPTEGDWLYFVSVKPGDTRFTASHKEHLENVKDFNEYQNNKAEDGG